MAWSLTGGQTHDITEATALLEGLSADVVVADKAYDGDALLERIEDSGDAYHSASGESSRATQI